MIFMVNKKSTIDSDIVEKHNVFPNLKHFTIFYLNTVTVFRNPTVENKVKTFYFLWIVF